MSELEERLRKRATETNEQIERRLQTARREMAEYEEPGLFDHVLENSGPVEDAVAKLRDVVRRRIFPNESEP